jgi:hypothetical protein
VNTPTKLLKVIEKGPTVVNVPEADVGGIEELSIESAVLPKLVVVVAISELVVVAKLDSSASLDKRMADGEPLSA